MLRSHQPEADLAAIEGDIWRHHLSTANALIVLMRGDCPERRLTRLGQFFQYIAHVTESLSNDPQRTARESCTDLPRQRSDGVLDARNHVPCGSVRGETAKKGDTGLNAVECR